MKKLFVLSLLALVTSCSSSSDEMIDEINETNPIGNNSNTNYPNVDGLNWDEVFNRSGVPNYRELAQGHEFYNGTSTDVKSVYYVDLTTSELKPIISFKENEYTLNGVTFENYDRGFYVSNGDAYSVNDRGGYVEIANTRNGSNNNPSYELISLHKVETSLSFTSLKPVGKFQFNNDYDFANRDYSHFTMPLNNFRLRDNYTTSVSEMGNEFGVTTSYNRDVLYSVYDKADHQGNSRNKVPSMILGRYGFLEAQFPKYRKFTKGNDVYEYDYSYTNSNERKRVCKVKVKKNGEYMPNADGLYVIFYK